jgi:hypothetical protein
MTVRYHPELALMDAAATYVFCVAHRATPLTFRGVDSGMPAGSAPRALAFAPRLWLIASQVPLSMYGPGSIEGRLNDLDWVSDAALAHDAVVERTGRLRGATVVPMKLFTMFSTPEKAVEAMRARKAEIDAIVKRVRGCSEWGVRVVRATSAADAPARRLDSGTAFLQAKKQARDRSREDGRLAAAAAASIYQDLGRAAKQARRRPSPDGAAAPPLLDAAFLVSDTGAAKFKTLVRKAGQACRAAGAELTLTGPWPPYNFVEDREEVA